MLGVIVQSAVMLSVGAPPHTSTSLSLSLSIYLSIYLSLSLSFPFYAFQYPIQKVEKKENLAIGKKITFLQLCQDPKLKLLIFKLFLWQTGRRADGQTGRRADGQTGRGMRSQACRTGGLEVEQMNINTNRQAARKTDRQMVV
jgi:hypothetical protein